MTDPIDPIPTEEEPEEGAAQDEHGDEPEFGPINGDDE